jgi:hypothetical protein
VHCFLPFIAVKFSARRSKETTAAGQIKGLTCPSCDTVQQIIAMVLFQAPRSLESIEFCVVFRGAGGLLPSREFEEEFESPIYAENILGVR